MEKQPSDAQVIRTTVQKKLESYRVADPSLTAQQQLEYYMHFLALAKIYVFTFKKNQILLVEAHRKLGNAYFFSKCFKQSLEHFLLANRKIHQLLKQAPSFQRQKLQIQCREVLNGLAKVLIQLKQHDQAKDVLSQLSEMQSSLGQDDNQKSLETMFLTAKVFANLSNFHEARLTIDRALERTKSQYGFHSQQYAKALSEAGYIFHMQNNNIRAKKLQQQCIDILIERGVKDFKQIPQLYITLAKYCGLLKDNQAQLKALNKAKSILHQIEPQSKRYANVRRKIAELYEVISITDAVQQYTQLVKIDGAVFGQTSVQLAKTFKSLGLIQIKLNRKSQARYNFQMAIKIFNENLQKEAAKECQEILQRLKGQSKGKREFVMYKM